MPTNTFPMEDRGAYIVDENTLKAIVASIEKFTKSGYRISVTFSDEFNHSGNDVADVVAHPYFRTHEARRVSISSSTEILSSPRNEITLTFSMSMSEARVSASISSDNDDLHIIRAELDREIKSSRAKYYFMYKIPSAIWFVLFSIAGGYFGIKSIAQFLFNHSGPNDTKETLQAVPGLALFIGFMFAMFVLWFSNRVKMYVMPALVISVGKSKEIAARKADTRKWAFRAAALAAISYAVKVFYT